MFVACVIVLLAYPALIFFMRVSANTVPTPSPQPAAAARAPPPPLSPQPPKLFTYEVVRELPHDPRAFTQGLQFDRYNGKEVFWESTGMYGESQVREVEVDTGRVLREVTLPRHLFGEGLTRVGDKLLQLTWQRGSLLEFASVDTFHTANTSSFTQGVALRDTGLRDGWGITYDGSHLVITDSTPTMRWLDPQSLAVVRSQVLRDGGVPVPWLNEIEWIDGEIWGNVWQTDCIARIDPATATVTGWLNLHGLAQRTRAAGAQDGVPMDVLNGIAHDPQTGRLFVTGKYWGRLYEIRVVEVAAAGAEALARVRQLCIPRVRGLF